MELRAQRSYLLWVHGAGGPPEHVSSAVCEQDYHLAIAGNLKLFAEAGLV